MLQSTGQCHCVVPRMIEAVSELHGLSLFGRQEAWRLVCIRGGVVMIVVGTACWLLVAVACFLGSLWGGGGGGSCSVVKLLGGRVAIVVCRQQFVWTRVCFIVFTVYHRSFHLNWVVQIVADPRRVLLLTRLLCQEVAVAL